MIYLVSFVAGAALALGLDNLPRLCLASVIMAVLWLFARRRPYAACLLVAGFALAIVRTPAPPAVAWDNPVSVSGYFNEPPRHYSRFNAQGFVPLAFDYAADDFPAEFNLLSKHEFIAGVPYSMEVRMVTPRRKMNPAAWEPTPYARPVRGGARAMVIDVPGASVFTSLSMMVAGLRHDLAREVDSVFPPHRAALVKAVTVGHRGDMPLELRQAFRRSGLAHLLSISGTHFGVFAVGLFFAFKVLVERLPPRTLLALTMRISPAQLAAVLTLPAMVFYLGLSGGSPPSVRAFVMTGLFLFGLLVSARGNWKGFLAAAAFVLVLWEPAVLGSPSFVLSFSAVLFIGLVLSGAQRYPSMANKAEAPGAGRRVFTVLVLRPVQLTFAASFGVLPFVIYMFHELSPVSPIANVLVTPLVCFLVVPLSIVGAAWYILFGSFVTAPLVGPLAGASASLAGWLSSFEWASYGVPPVPGAFVAVYYACVLPWLITRRRALLPLMAIPALLYAFYAYGPVGGQGVSVTFLDTGRSDAAVLELPGRSAVVVDTGYTGTEVSYYLRHRGIRKIDALILSHNHHDHTGGAPKLAEYYDIARVLDNAMVKRMPELDNLPRDVLVAGDTMKLPGATIRVLHPAQDFVPASSGTVRTNDNSLVLRVEAGGGASVLLTGDVQASGISALAALEPRSIRADIVKLPHHGKMVAESLRVIELSGARVAVQTGPPTYGFGQRRVISTWEQGAVKVLLGGGAPVVKTWAGHMPVKYPSTLGEELNNLAGFFRVF